jgi:hypothetical protein
LNSLFQQPAKFQILGSEPGTQNPRTQNPRTRSDEDRDECHNEQKRHHALCVARKIQFKHNRLPPFIGLDGATRQKFVTKV